ncbi:hypothetical protein ABIA22_000560 [Sinorhizobium fredii]
MPIVSDLIQKVIGQTPGYQPATLQVHGLDRQHHAS